MAGSIPSFFLGPIRTSCLIPGMKGVLGILSARTRSSPALELSESFYFARRRLSWLRQDAWQGLGKTVRKIS